MESCRLAFARPKTISCGQHQCNDGFKRNLIMVDSSMPEIIGNMLLYFYTEDVKDCDNLVDMLGDSICRNQSVCERL